MHITDLHIDRFGVWRDLALPLGGPGLNVLYGPNEAGKSTLMRFIRACLYGGVPPRSEADSLPMTGEQTVAGGSLRLASDGETYTVRRSFAAGGTSRVQLVGPENAPLPAERLNDLLGGTSEAVFDRLFAIDLYELQELATLDHAELADHIYGLSLGLKGRRLLTAVDDLRRERETLLSADGRGGRLVRLLDQEKSLLDRLRDLPDLTASGTELRRKQSDLDGRVGSLRRRRGEIEHELRGRRFMDKVHPSWRQVRQYRRDLAKLPAAADLPADGLKQLDGLEKEVDVVTRRRDDRRREADERKRKADALGAEPEIVRAEPAVRAMLGLRDWLKEAVASRKTAAESKTKLAAVAAKVRAGIGPEWTEAQLAAVDTSPQAQQSLMTAARGFRTAIARRADLRRRYKKLRQSSIKREATLRERLAGLGGDTIDSAAAQVNRRIEALELLAELKAKEAALEHRGKHLRQRLELAAEQLEIPPWVTFVLAVFAIGGAIFTVVGLVTGVTTSALAGAIYMLLGLTCGSLAVKLRSHFDTALRETVDRLKDERRAEEVELRKVREEVTRVMNGVPAGPRANPAVIPLSAARRTVPASPAEARREEFRHLQDLDDLARRQDRLRAERRVLTKLRARLRRLEQGVDAARQEWCATLAKLGLPETLDFDATLTHWRQLGEASAAKAAVAHADREHALLDRMLRAFGAQLDATGRRLGVKSDGERPVETLDGWERELQAAAAKAEERRKLLDQFAASERAVEEAEERLASLDRQRTALLAAAGVKSRADYERKLKAGDERRDLEALLELAEIELETAASAEPELAVVEEDLQAFRTDENAATLRKLSAERTDLEAQLEAALEERGQVVRRLDEISGDRREDELRREHARLSDLLRRTAERTLAAELAGRAAEQARQVYERDNQPPVLTAASELLSDLTRGRYRRVWVPLGTRTIRVDDDRDRTFAADQLSGGTREQLFLALRLGLVRQTAEAGVRLPVVLDDVFVNFDQSRTEAAFETLRTFAEGRQVLFFTCHLHLAQLAESRGVEPIWLPGHHPAVPHRLAG